MQNGGEKATVPRRSDGGKFNAMTHGLRANSRLLPGESPIAYGRLRSRLLRQFRPVGPAERILVEQTAEALWRLKRVAAVEAGLYTRTSNLRQESQGRVSKYNGDAHALDERQTLGDMWLHHSKSFLNLARYRTTIERPLGRNLRDLTALQAARAGRVADGGEVIDVTREGDTSAPRTTNGRAAPAHGAD